MVKKTSLSIHLHRHLKHRTTVYKDQYQLSGRFFGLEPPVCDDGAGRNFAPWVASSKVHLTPGELARDVPGLWRSLAAGRLPPPQPEHSGLNWPAGLPWQRAVGDGCGPAPAPRDWGATAWPGCAPCSGRTWYERAWLGDGPAQSKERKIAKDITKFDNTFSRFQKSVKKKYLTNP